MKKWLIGALVVLGFSSLATSQAAGFGVRAGYPVGLGVQYTASDTAGLRFAVGTYFANISGQADFLFHQPLALSGLNNLSMYYGGGAHAQFWFYGQFEAGAQGTFGVEWAFSPTLSVFWDASLGLGYYSGYAGYGGGLAPYYGSGVGLNFRG